MLGEAAAPWDGEVIGVVAGEGVDHGRFAFETIGVFCGTCGCVRPCAWGFAGVDVTGAAIVGVWLVFTSGTIFFAGGRAGNCCGTTAAPGCDLIVGWGTELCVILASSGVFGIAAAPATPAPKAPPPKRGPDIGGTLSVDGTLP